MKRFQGMRRVVFALLTTAGMLAGCGRTSAAAPAAAPFQLGTNLSGLADWSTEIPFKDVFKSARAWISQREGRPWGQGPPLELDAHGWPKRLEPGCRAETPMLTAEHDPGGAFVCLYEGKGNIEFGNVGGFRQVAPGEIAVDVKPNQVVWLRLLATDPDDPVRHIRFVRAADRATFEQDPWREDFLARWRGFKVVRFMDWQATNGSQVREWADRPTVDDAVWTTHGVPLEMMVDYCNRTGNAPWFCLPHLASDDFVRQFARLVKGTLRADLPVYVEYSNELWNYGFQQTGWCRDEGKRLGLSDNDHQAMLRFASQRSVAIFGIWEEVFGGAERLRRVMASQSANAWNAEQKLTWQNAAAHCDALAIAPYFGYQFGDPRTANEVAAWPVEQLLDRCLQAIDTDVREHIESHLKLLANPQVTGGRKLELIAYEAGQHLVGHGGAENNEALTNLFIAANRHPRMGELYRRYITQWRELGGGLLCNFSSVGRPSKWGSWGVLESESQDPATAPKLQALLEFVVR